jgi:hypothetical protein
VRRLPVFGRLFPTKSYCEIDEKVQKLIDALNNAGAVTIASCQGHGAYGKPPYVYFKGSTDLAASMERLLREAAIGDDPRLQTMWVVEGVFDGNYELAFLLRSPEYHRRSNDLLGAPWVFWLNRQKLDAELLSLAAIVEQAVLLNIREKPEPKIAAGGKGYDKSK